MYYWFIGGILTRPENPMNTLMHKTVKSLQFGGVLMGMSDDLAEKFLRERALRILYRAVGLMAAELAEALPNKPDAGSSEKWIRYAEATIERDERAANV
jgi:hypothetical protein